VRIWQLRGDEKSELFIVLHGGVSEADPEQESTWFDGMGFGLPWLSLKKTWNVKPFQKDFIRNPLKDFGRWFKLSVNISRTCCSINCCVDMKN